MTSVTCWVLLSWLTGNACENDMPSVLVTPETVFMRPDGRIALDKQQPLQPFLSSDFCAPEWRTGTAVQYTDTSMEKVHHQNCVLRDLFVMLCGSQIQFSSMVDLCFSSAGMVLQYSWYAKYSRGFNYFCWCVKYVNLPVIYCQHDT